MMTSNKTKTKPPYNNFEIVRLCCVHVEAYESPVQSIPIYISSKAYQLPARNELRKHHTPLRINHLANLFSLST